MTVPVIKFDTYHDYEAMTGHLKALADAFPKLATLTSLGKTFQGRDIWAVTITNPATGAPDQKPGYYIDAQIHAEEHATSAVALYAIWHLLTQYGRDEEVTRLVDQQVFYILPRINPDGAELSLQPPYYHWCGNGRYMPGFDRLEGLKPQDIDGDGYVTTMRVPDPKGEWKKSASDPRVMVQREPGEEGGAYFRLYPEGLIENYDGVHVKIERPFDGNLNRNFPVNWSPREYGAGESALSEPESKAMADFILGRPNIAGLTAYHTHGGIILRPSMTKPDSAMSPRDLALYKDLGAVGQRLTGYPTISTYEEFTPDKSKPRYGSLKDWTYEEMGIVSFSTELWDLETEAGVEKVAYYNLRPRTEAIQAKVFAWVLANVGDHGYRDWKAFDHPQLGPIETGGMVYIWTYRNPPPGMLEEICRRNTAFNLRHAAAAPRVLVDSVFSEKLADGLYKIRAVVSNHGYLPTNLTDVAIQNGVAKPVGVSVAGDGINVVMNPQQVEIGHLAGRNERKYTWSPWGQQWSPVSKPVEWLVRADDPSASIVVTASSEKGGTHQMRTKL
ncbi:M14 family metallopeptidase [Microvirga antarctica]|uniref:M14 family metallopeptidase n=1 Tax=Microvirga antarctica TaxID=2819233 RepID=UPI001B303D30|nr:M14 family metallopeptidase [Microvirga antarctica]